MESAAHSVTKLVIQIVIKITPTLVSIDGYGDYIYRVEAAAVAAVVAVVGRKGQRRWTRSARPCH